MRRTYLASMLAALAISLPAIGCSYCATPYDYCGPTFTGGPGDLCDARARAGSILWPPHGQIEHADHYEYEFDPTYDDWSDGDDEIYERPVEYEEPIQSTRRPTTRLRR